MPRTPEAVRIVTVTPNDPNLVEIGVIEGRSGMHSPLGDSSVVVFDDVRKAAGEHGCDTIAVRKPEERLGATSNGTPLYSTVQQATCYVKR